MPEEYTEKLVIYGDIFTTLNKARGEPCPSMPDMWCGISTLKWYDEAEQKGELDIFR